MCVYVYVSLSLCVCVCVFVFVSVCVSRDSRDMGFDVDDAVVPLN